MAGTRPTGLAAAAPSAATPTPNTRFWWTRVRAAKAAQPWLEDGFIASRRDALGPIEHHGFTATVWAPAIVNAGLDWAPTFHDLRHAMVSWSLDAGTALRTVQLDGHASIRTTEVYVHRLNSRVPSERLAAMERMYQRMDAGLAIARSLPTESRLRGPAAKRDRRDTA
jgi:integrase